MTRSPDRAVAVTGAAGRLGSELVRRLVRGGWLVQAWTRAEFDLDDPEPIARRMTDEAPGLVIHTAAWTDVDGCARDPNLAMARNATATSVLAAACRAAAASLLIVSSNEVFDGTRTDGRGYGPADQTNPPNPYGRSKLAAELGAVDAFGGFAGLGIVRTAWLFGAGKQDFPARIAAAAQAAAAEGRTLRLVSDEIGTPTYVQDLAAAIVALSRGRIDGIHHVVNSGIASRAEWARDVFERMHIEVPVEEIRLDQHTRPSRPPRWGVLAPTPMPGGPLRSWREAMADRMGAVEALP
jgi:dTDP-4-dehydrorhamnose reductase